LLYLTQNAANKMKRSQQSQQPDDSSLSPFELKIDSFQDLSWKTCLSTTNSVAKPALLVTDCGGKVG